MVFRELQLLDTPQRASLNGRFSVGDFAFSQGGRPFLARSNRWVAVVHGDHAVLEFPDAVDHLVRTSSHGTR